MLNSLTFLIPMIAKVTPEEVLMDKVDEALVAYKSAKLCNDAALIEEKKNKLLVALNFFISKLMDVDPIEVAKQLEQMERADQLFNPNKQ